MNDFIVGIDLGTTNSEIAAFHGGEVSVVGSGDTQMLPSCVGFSASGELLVGTPARNHQTLYPERTVRSIKRKMGLDETVSVADKELTPQEVSALILSELAEWAARSPGERPQKAVITVPAYFPDAQRNATREAGALAGLEVIRILNEPTAASLAYGYGDGTRHNVLIYDLGGGTFDVSVVMVERDITEVLASHGNNRLGGDDFDDLLADRFAQEFMQQHGIDLRRGHAAAQARLWWAAEEAKKKLSFERYIKIREEALVVDKGTPRHLEMEISRQEYVNLIRSLVESTLDSVSKALRDAGKKSSDMDAILLVGGSTRTPLVTDLLIEHTGLTPRQDVHPDLCVALGAGVLASRLSGHSIERVLVDVSPYSFGISYLGERGGFPYPHCYRPIIRRNVPLPLTRTESYGTSHPFQTEAVIEVYQGDDDDALKNIRVGDFHVEGLTPLDGPNELLCRMRLDLDGILEVTAVEQRTGNPSRSPSRTRFGPRARGRSLPGAGAFSSCMSGSKTNRWTSLRFRFRRKRWRWAQAPDLAKSFRLTRKPHAPITKPLNCRSARAVCLATCMRTIARRPSISTKKSNPHCNRAIPVLCRQLPKRFANCCSSWRDRPVDCAESMSGLSGARFRGARLCSRCGADLKPLMLLAAKAWLLREAARQSLDAGEFDRAHKLSLAAQELQFTRSGDSLRLLSAWLGK